MHGFNFNQTQSQGCNSNIWNTHPICNPISMQYNNIDKQNEEYKISSSLKTIWNNACESKPTTFNHPFDNSDSGADMKKMTKSPVATGFDKLDDEIALVANLLNGNALKGRAITARNGLQNSNYMSNFGIENGSINQVTILTRNSYSPLINRYIFLPCPPACLLNKTYLTNSKSLSPSHIYNLQRNFRIILSFTSQSERKCSSSSLPGFRCVLCYYITCGEKKCSENFHFDF